MRRALALPLALVLFAAAPARAEVQDTLPPWDGGLTSSLGQPVRNRWFSGATLGVVWPRGEAAALSMVGRLGIERPIGSPIVGLLGASAELYGGVRGTRPTGGARAMLGPPLLGLAAGADYSFADRALSPALALALPLRRGGTVGKGSLFRLEWLTAVNAVGVSTLLPLRQPFAGHTRPRNSSVVLPARPAPASITPQAPVALAEALANVRTAALRVQELVVPPLGHRGMDPQRALAPVIRELRTIPRLPGVAAGPDLQVDQTVRALHAELARAFAIAADGRPLSPGNHTPRGDSLASLARGVLLDHILLPVDRLLGQRKTGKVVPGLGAYASGNFARAVLADGLASEERREAVLYVFRELLATMEAVELKARHDWPDSRELWMPLQLALLPEQHETQAQIDSLLEHALGQQFTDGNQVWYVINESLQEEVQQTIGDARDYHVLWIHDFRGVTETGQPDRMSLKYVVGAYLRALTEAVRRYDTDPRHRLPVYLIFLDQHYYEINTARLFLDVLEHPLRVQLSLPAGDQSLRARQAAMQVAAAQVELRKAVAESSMLTAERAQYGEAWLENLVSVHVNITNPVDPSFRARGILPLVGLPDNWLRDHRKIVFYDVSEDDPYTGLALYTGIGVGEHYSGPSWEDRAIMVRGPSLLSLKGQARRLLLSQGLRPEQIPAPLRPWQLAADYGAKVDSVVAIQKGILDQRAMELHNQTGYAEKPIDVAKAMLYELMPSGSVVKVPDSLWQSRIYAALLAGSAWRGVRVLVIAPSYAAAPSRGIAAMALAHDLLSRLIVLQNALRPELEASGGLLKTGIYNPGVGVDDIYGRFIAAYENARRTPFIRRLLPLNPIIDTALVRLPQMLAAQRMQQTKAAPGADTAQAPPRTQGLGAGEPSMPKLHLKANFFASRVGWDSMVARPEVMGALSEYMNQSIRGPGGVREASQALSKASQDLVENYLASRPAEEKRRAVYYMLVGSANQDYRSMYLDGEASVLLSGRSAVVGLVDFALLVSLSVWVDDQQTLDDLLPARRGIYLVLARWIKPLN